MTIWKYKLELTHLQTLEVPRDCRPLSVAYQGADLCIWFLVEESRPKRKRRIQIHGTGNPIHDVVIGGFVGTVHQPPFVWHVFDLGWVHD